MASRAFLDIAIPSVREPFVQCWRNCYRHVQDASSNPGEVGKFFYLFVHQFNLIATLICTNMQ